MVLNPYEQARAIVYDLNEYRTQRELAKNDIDKLGAKLQEHASGLNDREKEAVRNQIAQAERYLNLSARESQATYGLAPGQLTQAWIKDLERRLPAIERQYPPLEQQPVGAPLQEMNAVVTARLDGTPPPAAQGLTEAQRLAATRDRRGIDNIPNPVMGDDPLTLTPADAEKISEWFGPRGGPLKDTLDAVRGPERTPPARPEASYVDSFLQRFVLPPQPQLGQWLKEQAGQVMDQAMEAVQRRLPYTPPAPTITPRLEQMQSEIGPLPPPPPVSPAGSDKPPTRRLNEPGGQEPHAQAPQGQVYRGEMAQYSEPQPPPTPQPPEQHKDFLSQNPGQPSSQVRATPATQLDYEARYQLDPLPGQASEQASLTPPAHLGYEERYGWMGQQFQQLEQGVQHLTRDMQAPPPPPGPKEFDIRNTLNFEDRYKTVEPPWQPPPPEQTHDR
jgi:hypothetical protein